jgi:hypothetical protein
MAKRFARPLDRDYGRVLADVALGHAIQHLGLGTLQGFLGVLSVMSP